MYTDLALEQSIIETKKNLESKGYAVFVANNKEEALEKIKSLIPQGASVMNGASQTLEQIGFIAHLKSGTHGWNNLHEKILAEKDPEKQAALRKQSVLSDFYLGSVHALTEQGEAIIASNSGSQLPHIVFTSANIIFVVSTKKIVPILEEGMQRLYKHVIPLEDARMMKAYNAHTAPNKIVILNGESKMSKRKISFLLIKEDLGF